MVDRGDNKQRAIGNCYVLVYGVPPPEAPIALGPGISLLPLPNPLDLFDLMAVGAAGFSEASVLEPLIRGCGCEIESAEDAAVVPGFDSLNRAWLAVTLLVLNGFYSAKGVAVSSYRWQDVPIPDCAASWNGPNDVANRRIRTGMPRFRGGLLDLHLRMIRLDNAAISVTPEIARWLTDRFEIANELIARHPSLQLAARAASDWRFSPDHRSAIARLWSGIEAMMCIDQELSYRIAIYSASILEPRGDLRVKKYHAVKKLYAQRSKAVHGTSLKDKELVEATVGAFELLRDLLLNTFNRNKLLTVRELEEIVMG